MTRLWVYSIFHNEAPMLPFFLRHYLSVADRVVLFDDHSTDGGPALAAAAGAEVRPYPHQGLDDMQFVDFAAATYPEARGQADWVIWVDADEFIYHPFLRMTLARYTASGVTLPLVDGYAMYAPAFPQGAGQIYDEIKTGVPYAPESKLCVFDPRIEISWHAGKHGLRSGHSEPRSQTAELKLLHYRHLGGEWFDGRNARNYGHMTPENIARQLGWQVYPENHHKAGWHTQQEMFAQMREVV